MVNRGYGLLAVLLIQAVKVVVKFGNNGFFSGV
jgi:hypothetical protein